MFCIFLGKSNLSAQLGLTEHIKQLQCTSSEEIWNLYSISSLPSLMHSIVNTLCWSLAVQPNCLKGRVVCGTVYGEMHLKDLLGSFVRVGYRIPVPDFYLVLHGLCCRKSTIIDLIWNCGDLTFSYAYYLRSRFRTI